MTEFIMTQCLANESEYIRTISGLLRKIAKNLVMSARPSVRMGQLGSHWKDFREI
jgi:hypothetical protein